MPKFCTKSASFGYFGAKILKSLCHLWNQHPRIYQVPKFRENVKIAKFGAKKNITWIFWGWNLKTVLPYLKLAPSNLCNWKNLRNNKDTWFWEWKCHIWVFLVQIFKKLFSYLKSTPSGLSNYEISWRNKNA